MAKTPKTEATDNEAADPVVEQGQMAKELGLPAEACPYGEGDNRDRWMAGYEA